MLWKLVGVKWMLRWWGVQALLGLRLAAVTWAVGWSSAKRRAVGGGSMLRIVLSRSDHLRTLRAIGNYYNHLGRFLTKTEIERLIRESGKPTLFGIAHDQEARRRFRRAVGAYEAEWAVGRFRKRAAAGTRVERVRKLKP